MQIIGSIFSFFSTIGSHVARVFGWLCGRRVCVLTPDEASKPDAVAHGILTSSKTAEENKGKILASSNTQLPPVSIEPITVAPSMALLPRIKHTQLWVLDRSKEAAGKVNVEYTNDNNKEITLYVEGSKEKLGTIRLEILKKKADGHYEGWNHPHYDREDLIYGQHERDEKHDELFTEGVVTVVFYTIQHLPNGELDDARYQEILACLMWVAMKISDDNGLKGRIITDTGDPVALYKLGFRYAGIREICERAHRWIGEAISEGRKISINNPKSRYLPMDTIARWQKHGADNPSP